MKGGLFGWPRLESRGRNYVFMGFIYVFFSHLNLSAVSTNFKWLIKLIKNVSIRVGSRIFLRERGRWIFKKILKNLSTFFSGRPN